MKKTILTLILFGFVITVKSQNVTIPDANFRAYLVGNTAINTNGDDTIQVSEANNYTGFIICNQKNISDLTGIEAFENITALNCANNNLTQLNLGNKPKLTTLNCPNNKIKSILIRQHDLLVSVYAHNNEIENLDTLMAQPNMIVIDLNIGNNEISTLNLNNCRSLEALSCSDNNLTQIDLSGLSNLTSFKCSYNDMASIDISSNSKVDVFEATNCSNLTSLNVANGNNKNFKMMNLPPFGNVILFSASGNPKLPCIQVDDTTYSNSNWDQGHKDATASYSENCGGSASIKSTELLNLTVYPNPTSTTITVDLPNVISIQILDLKGLEIITTHQATINVQSLTPGMYIIRATDGEQIYTSRFIKN